MGSIQIVFLFDLNACPDFLLKPKEELIKKLLSIRLACLRLLSDFNSHSSNFKWGFKFFDSNGSITQNMCKFAFSDVSLEAFETLENEVCVRYERHIDLLQALEASQKTASSTSDFSNSEVVKSYPVKVFQFALTQILCEFQWEPIDMWSPSTKKIKDKSFFSRKRNFVFLFSDFKDNDEKLFSYFGLDSLPSKQKFINTFLPQALRESLLHKANIHLVFLNTCDDQKFMGPLSSSLLPVLSESLQSVQGSMIPLLFLAQPLYNMQFSKSLSESLNNCNVPNISDVYSSFHNSLLPFSSLFQLSLHYLFYSKITNMDNRSSINFVNGDVKIPVRILNIFNEKEELIEETKMKQLPCKKARWLKFNVQSVVPKNVHYDAGYEMLLCLPDSSKSDFHETDLIKLNKNCCIEKVNLILECITNYGESIPGLFTPLSAEAAVISVLYPEINHLQLKSNFENYAVHTLNFQDAQIDTNLFDAENYKVSLNVSSLNKGYAEKLENIFLKPFQMECLEKWFKSTSKPNLESYVQSRSSKETSKVKPFYKMLQQFARNSKKLNSKSSKKNVSSLNEENICSISNSEKKEEKSPGSLSCPESEDIKFDESDFSYEELLSVLNKEYNAALESGNIIAASKRIVKMVINFHKKRDNSNLEEDVQNLFKDSFILTDRKIIEKYEMLETDEAKKKKIKECQIQVLLTLEIENSKQCPDRSNCVDTVSPLLRLVIFWSGIEESENFMQEILLKNYSHQLYDVLVEIGEEVGLSKSFLDDAESVNSPTDTISSELMNEEEIFSSTISSNISEKSSSSICSRKDKENNIMERKLLRRRSDISIAAGVRQVVLPKSSSKKRKKKAVANKVVRCSPRIASMKKEQLSRSLSEKPRTVRRNLFPGSGQTPKKNKNNQPNTPKSKKKENQLTKTKYVAETPSHKQNHSALQRRKSVIDKTSDSPKVINESPQIVKTVTDATNKELLEKLQKARLNLLKPAVPSSQKSRSPNFTQYTPESKRRLSLKLFSKLLASPTARMGIKKCTKRLFDQISPKKDDNSNNKRHKPNDDCE